MNSIVTGKDMHSLYLHLLDTHVPRGGSHVSSSWHWLQGLPSRIYPSSHTKVTLCPYWNTLLISRSFWIPFINGGRLHFTSGIRKIRRKLIFYWELLVISAISNTKICDPKPTFPSAKISQELLTTPTSYDLKLSDFNFLGKVVEYGMKYNPLSIMDNSATGKLWKDWELGYPCASPGSNGSYHKETGISH